MKAEDYRALMSEDALVAWIIQYANLHGWKAVHYRPAWTNKGYRTAIQGDRGAPDLLLARAGVVLLPETKDAKGTLGPGQAEWAREIGAQYRLWRPSDIDEIQKELR